LRTDQDGAAHSLRRIHAHGSNSFHQSQTCAFQNPRSPKKTRTRTPIMRMRFLASAEDSTTGFAGSSLHVSGFTLNWTRLTGTAVLSGARVRVSQPCQYRRRRSRWSQGLPRPAGRHQRIDLFGDRQIVCRGQLRAPRAIPQQPVLSYLKVTGSKSGSCQLQRCTRREGIRSIRSLLAFVPFVFVAVSRGAAGLFSITCCKCSSSSLQRQSFSAGRRRQCLSSP